LDKFQCCRLENCRLSTFFDFVVHFLTSWALLFLSLVSLGTNQSATTRKILCVHGWLDNAASFNRLAPLLLDSISTPTELIALDFPGHGLSGHKSADGPPQLLAEYAYYVAECLEALKWGSVGGAGGGNGGEKVTIIGHSMGGGVSVVFAAAFPELCSSLILLEGGGPLARNAHDCARHVRAACQRRLKSNKLLFNNSNDGKASGVRVYPNIGAAIEARLATVKRMPGEQYMSEECAEDLVSRAVVSSSDSSSEAVTFRHDPRLQWPSLQYFTREQVEACYHDIHDAKVPVCLLVANDGYPVDSISEKAIREILQPSFVKKLSGSHHFHADPDSVGPVVNEIVQFMNTNNL
jgi:pimeloyl-ACP methyl ester carboxylesterase